MRNIEHWQPTKFITRRGRLCASRDSHELSVSSRLVANLVAAAYDRAFKEHATGRMLDMGCGKVPFYAAYRPHVSDVQCVDWGNSRHGQSHVDQECDLSARLPYSDGEFDTILLSDVLEHLAEPANCWREMQRLLKPGGKVLLNVPFYYQIHEEPHDYYRYTEFALRRFAEQSGFSVVELSPLGGALEILADVSGKLMAGAGVMWAAGVVQSAALAFNSTTWGTKIAKRTRDRFPLGYFMVARKPDSTFAGASETIAS